MKRFFHQGTGHSQRVLCYWHPVNENQADSCDMWEAKRWVQANKCKMVGCHALQETEIGIKSVGIFGGLHPTCQSQLSDNGPMTHVLVHRLSAEQNRRSYIFHNFIRRGICNTGLEETSWNTDHRKAGKLCLFQKSQQNINAFSSTMNLKVTRLSP